MNVETIVNDVKERVEPIIEQGQEIFAQGQDVVLAGFETLKSANSIVIEGVTMLVKTQVEAGRDLISVAQESFAKARTDGLKAVAADPIAYIPESKERLLSAYNDSVAVVSKTGDELVKTFKLGFETISAKINGEPVVVKKARSTVKKTAGKAKKAYRAAA